jgi:hypothetical protein
VVDYLCERREYYYQSIEYLAKKIKVLNNYPIWILGYGNAIIVVEVGLVVILAQEWMCTYRY